MNIRIIFRWFSLEQAQGGEQAGQSFEASYKNKSTNDPASIA
jgi:hypothetical protein